MVVLHIKILKSNPWKLVVSNLAVSLQMELFRTAWISSSDEIRATLCKNIFWKFCMLVCLESVSCKRRSLLDKCGRKMLSVATDSSSPRASERNVENTLSEKNNNNSGFLFHYSITSLKKTNKTLIFRFTNPTLVTHR